MYEVAARTTGIIVGIVYLAFPWFYLASLSPGNDVTRTMISVLSAVWLAGAMLVYGCWKWRGASAHVARILGFALALISGLATFSYAFMLVPFALLAALSLGRERTAEKEEPTLAAP
jgi:hypothetical protein